jgi:hypothetical protein
LKSSSDVQKVDSSAPLGLLFERTCIFPVQKINSTKGFRVHRNPNKVCPRGFTSIKSISRRCGHCGKPFPRLQVLQSASNQSRQTRAMVLVALLLFASLIENAWSGDADSYLLSFGLNITAFPRRFSKTGDDTCRCLTADELKPFEWDDLAPAGKATLFGFVNKSEYGYGCAPHDIKTPACTESCGGCYQDWCRRRYESIPL